MCIDKCEWLITSRQPPKTQCSDHQSSAQKMDTAENLSWGSELWVSTINTVCALSQCAPLIDLCSLRTPRPHTAAAASTLHTPGATVTQVECGPKNPSREETKPEPLPCLVMRRSGAVCNFQCILRVRQTRYQKALEKCNNLEWQLDLDSNFVYVCTFRSKQRWLWSVIVIANLLPRRLLLNKFWCENLLTVNFSRPFGNFGSWSECRLYAKGEKDLRNDAPVVNCEP